MICRNWDLSTKSASCYWSVTVPRTSQWRRCTNTHTRDRTHVPCTAGGFLTTAPPGKSREFFIMFKNGNVFRIQILILSEFSKTMITSKINNNFMQSHLHAGKTFSNFFCKFCDQKNILQIYSLKYLIQGLPWRCSGWESACQCRGHGFEPWSGKIPRAAERLGPWATITEPARLEPVLRNKRGRDSERPAHRDEEWPPLATTRESPCTETKTQHSQK